MTDGNNNPMRIEGLLAAVASISLLLAGCSDPGKRTTTPGEPEVVEIERSNSPELAAAAKPERIGVAITPKHFPDHSDRDMLAAFVEAAEIGDAGVLIVQWGNEDLIRICEFAIAQCRDAGLTPVIGLSPTSLEAPRKELDLPAELRRSERGRISFSNSRIRQRFVGDSIALARLKPAYLCLATEINFLAIHRLEEFLHFVTLYKQAYTAVKRVSPESRVFVSFQWEWMRIVDSKEPLKIAEHTKVIDIFRPELDLVGLTTYPSPFHQSPQELVPDYYSWVKKHTRESDRIAWMEVGWPSGGSGSPAEQSEYIRRIPMLMSELNIELLAWSLLHDVGLRAFNADLSTTGLRSNDGNKKPSFAEFKRIRDAW